MPKKTKDQFLPGPLPGEEDVEVRAHQRRRKKAKNGQREFGGIKHNTPADESRAQTKQPTMRRICRAEATRATLKVATRRFPSSYLDHARVDRKGWLPARPGKRCTTGSRHPHFEAAPEGARRRTCKGEQQRFPREDRRLSAYQAAEAYRLTACSGRLRRSENCEQVFTIVDRAFLKVHAGFKTVCEHLKALNSRWISLCAGGVLSGRSASWGAGCSCMRR